MKEKVIAAAFNTPLKMAPVSGETVLTHHKHLGIEMFTGERQGFLTIHYQGRIKGIPFSNVNICEWEEKEQER